VAAADLKPVETSAVVARMAEEETPAARTAEEDKTAEANPAEATAHVRRASPSFDNRF
jgi:hypothetical protein